MLARVQPPRSALFFLTSAHPISSTGLFYSIIPALGLTFEAYQMAEYAPHAAMAGDELQTVILAPSAQENSVYVCPSDCGGVEICATLSFGCTAPSTRRFEYLFGSLSPSERYFQDFTYLSARKAKTIALVYEHELTLYEDMIKGVRNFATKFGLQIVADIGIAIGGSKPIPRDFLVNQVSAGKLAPDVIKREIKSLGTWQDAATPVVAIIQQLDVDVVVGGTTYDGCVGLLKAFVSANVFPKAIGLSECVGNPELYKDLDKLVRWLAGSLSLRSCVVVPPAACAFTPFQPPLDLFACALRLNFTVTWKPLSFFCF
jgi:hypothetical protein